MFLREILISIPQCLENSEEEQVASNTTESVHWIKVSQEIEEPCLLGLEYLQEENVHLFAMVEGEGLPEEEEKPEEFVSWVPLVLKCP